MSARLRGIARENERIVAAGEYRAPSGRLVSLAGALRQACDGTRVHGPGPLPTAAGPWPETTAATVAEGAAREARGAEREARGAARDARVAARDTGGAELDARGAARSRGAGPLLEVTGESTLTAAARLTCPDTEAGGAGTPVAALNFASARNPGGGYVNGAQAQEEALCRASALYPCLLRARGFYDHHRAHRDPFYTDRVVHSPAVPVFRDEKYRLLDTPFPVAFLTAAAPNAGVVRRTVPERAGELPSVLAVRAERVLETAVAEGYRRLVLGAWGCGVFQNDPAAVAGAFRALLAPGSRFAPAFDHVVFAVLDRTPSAAVRSAFERTFAEPQLQP